jgi:CDP-glucose 4,6-dehydratase
MANDFWRDRPVLVTGATGLLGNWLIKSLVERGSDVTCLIRDWVPQSELSHSRLIERVKTVRGGVDDQSLLERMLGEYEIDTVFHLAAQTIVPIANRNPVSTFETNIGGTWKMLEACRRSPKVKQIVVASSDKAYGTHTALPYSEDAALQAEYPYDVSKSCADLISRCYFATFGLPVVVTRCGNLFGGGDLNWNRIVPGTIRSVLRGQQPVIRSDGLNVRDYIYVEDAAAAYMLLAQKLEEDRRIAGEAFNVSYEQPMTVIDLVNAILRVMGSSLAPVVRNEASGEIREQYLTSTKVRSRIGWQPLFTLEEGLLRTLDWYKEILETR